MKALYLFSVCLYLHLTLSLCLSLSAIAYLRDLHDLLGHLPQTMPHFRLCDIEFPPGHIQLGDPGCDVWPSLHVITLQHLQWGPMRNSEPKGHNTPIVLPPWLGGCDISVLNCLEIYSKPCTGDVPRDSINYIDFKRISRNVSCCHDHPSVVIREARGEYTWISCTS